MLVAGSLLEFSFNGFFTLVSHARLELSFTGRQYLVHYQNLFHWIFTLEPCALLELFLFELLL